MKTRDIHPDFLRYLELKDPALIELFVDLRAYVLACYPEANELLYHTHALTAVFSISDKLSDAFVMLPIYTKHVNLGFNKGALLKDPKKLLQRTGKWIRHVKIDGKADYNNEDVSALIHQSIQFAIKDVDKASKIAGTTISKIKPL